VPVGAFGAILVPTDKILLLAGTGDFDEDGDVDLADFRDFQGCFGAGGSPDLFCRTADMDADGDVDGSDYTAFEASLDGPA